MKSKELQVYEFLNCSVNWEIFRSTARLILKNPNFRYLCELGKTWKYSLRPRFHKVSILNLLRNWEKLYPNLSFTVENKMGNYTRLATFQT